MHKLGSWFPELDFSSLPVRWHVKQGDWSDDPAAVALDELTLLRVGSDNLVERVEPGFELIRTCAASQSLGRPRRARIGQGAADQLAAGRPVKSHATLGSVHRLGDRQPELPEVTSIGECCVPVDACFEPWLDRLHFLVWANTYHARGGIEPVWWWARKAARITRTASLVVVRLAGCGEKITASLHFVA